MTTIKVAHVAPTPGDVNQTPLSVCIDIHLPSDAPMSAFRPARDEIRGLGKKLQEIPGVDMSYSDVTYTAWPEDGSVELHGHITVRTEHYPPRETVDAVNAAVPEFLRTLGYDVSVG